MLFGGHSTAHILTTLLASTSTTSISFAHPTTAIRALCAVLGHCFPFHFGKRASLDRTSRVQNAPFALGLTYRPGVSVQRRRGWGSVLSFFAETVESGSCRRLCSPCGEHMNDVVKCDVKIVRRLRRVEDADASNDDDSADAEIGKRNECF